MIELKHFAISEFDAAGEPGTGQLMRVCTLMNHCLRLHKMLLKIILLERLE